MEKSVKDRLLEFLEYKNVGQGTFEKQAGISNGYINNLKGSIGTKILNKIELAYPELNINWLRLGSESMLKGANQITTDSPNPSKKGVPYYEDIQATGGIITSYEDYPETPSFYIDYEHFNDCTAYLPVTGDSMFPQYCSGEIVAIRRIFNFDVILWGEAYLVVTNSNANDLRTIKLIFPHEDQSKIILRACNPDYKGDTVINKEDILFLYIIKGKIKRNQL